ncbi:amidase [Pusillimonas sp.]|uniref:amidase n=1 Tax=Pusillimonas sp. TaxID=3040095 RepID=UPI0037C98A78
MSNSLIYLTATEVAQKLKRKEISPLDLIDAVEKRVAEVDPVLNALPTLCLDRAREHAKRLMAAKDARREHEAGWLWGIPIAIKDTVDVQDVRTTYGSPLFATHVPKQSHALVQRIEGKGGIVIAKSNTPEFGAGGTTFNEVFGRTVNPWNTALTCGGSTGGGAAALASGQVWLAHGTDHGGSLRRPASYCGVVGIRCSPGRVTRGAGSDLWSPLVVQGPMARNVPDLALFLDAMVGECIHDPLARPAPSTSFVEALERPRVPKRIAFTPDFGGKVRVDRETREICARAVRRFEDLGAEVVEDCPDIGNAAEVFQILRAHHMLVGREWLLKQPAGKVKPDLLRNIERGQGQSVLELAWAERERALLYQRITQFMETYDLLISPAAATPPFDAALRYPQYVDGMPVEHYTAASLINSLVTLMSNPAIALPCGLDEFSRPIGLQLIGKMHGETELLQAAALFEESVGLSQRVPLNPIQGQVPPANLRDAQSGVSRNA